MTPQEEQMLVRIIVQCVRAVLEAADRETTPAQSDIKPGGVTSGSRFIDVVPRQETTGVQLNGGQNGQLRETTSRKPADVRESLRRFLRTTEPGTPAAAQAESAGSQASQKRQLITREEVLAALQQGSKVIALQPDAVVTPLARQVAKEKGIELR